MALDIVRDTTQYDSLVAPDASEITPEQLGFRYTDSQGETFIAFELKEDFPNYDAAAWSAGRRLRRVPPLPGPEWHHENRLEERPRSFAGFHLPRLDLSVNWL